MSRRRKTTTLEFIQNTIAIHGDRYDYSLIKYVNNRTKIKIICSKHGTFQQTPSSHLMGRGCNKCAKDILAIKFKKTIKQFITDAIKIHGDVYDYSLSVYVNSKTKIKIICKKHGIFEQNPGNHIQGEGCYHCGVERNTYNQRKSPTQFISDAIKIHGNKYDYSCTKYTNNRSKIEIICNKHGTFKQSPGVHLQGKGCHRCGIENNTTVRRKTINQFIMDAIKIHGSKYDYSLVYYTNALTHINIRCKHHGIIFKQTPNSHLEGKGCQKCRCDNLSKKRRKPVDEFIREANKIHKNRYDYTQVDYTNNNTKVKIICPIHGEFEQTPLSHLQQKSDCPKCTTKISKPETLWLDSLSIPNDKEHRQVRIGKYLVDGYNPKTNTIYEFHGDFWHGNPLTTNHTKKNPISKKPFKQLYKETLKKERLIRESGYNLVTMWENDWNNLKTAP